jgi:hypothetical protein
VSFQPATYEEAKASFKPLKRSQIRSGSPKPESSRKTLSAGAIARRPRNSRRARKKVPSTKKVQTIFNRMVRERAEWKCIRCGRDCSERKGLLHASHFWGVGFTATRFDFDNVDALCYPCHYGQLGTGWEYCKQGDYRTYMIKKLGQDGYDALEQKARTPFKLADAKQQFMDWYRALNQANPLLREASTRDRKGDRDGHFNRIRTKSC